MKKVRKEPSPLPHLLGQALAGSAPNRAPPRPLHEVAEPNASQCRQQSYKSGTYDQSTIATERSTLQPKQMGHSQAKVVYRPTKKNYTAHAQKISACGWYASDSLLCCGIDIHQAQLMACLRRVSSAGQITNSARTGERAAPQR